MLLLRERPVTAKIERDRDRAAIAATDRQVDRLVYGLRALMGRDR